MGPNASQGIQFKPEMFSMLSLLPPNYNFSKIPPEVFKQVMKGEMPDLTLLPQDVLDYIRENSEKIFKSFKISVSFWKKSLFIDKIFLARNIFGRDLVQITKF